MPSQRPRILLVNRALIFRKDGKVLMLQRSINDSYMPQKWELPGGKLDEGQDVNTAFLREIKEETGLTVEQVNPVMFVQSYVVESGPYEGITYIGLYGTAKTANENVVLSHEHNDFLWTNFIEAEKLEKTPELSMIFEDLRKKWQKD